MKIFQILIKITARK